VFRVLVDAARLRKKIVQGRPEVSAFDDEHLGATLAWSVLVSAEITPRTVVKSVISLSPWKCGRSASGMFGCGC
jgi:hypothetical protein